MADPLTKARDRFRVAIERVEKMRRTRIYSIIHRPAHPQIRDHGDHMCGLDLYRFYLARNTFPRTQRVELLLHTGGGSADVAYQIASVFRAHCKGLKVLVPLMAKSAGTLLCLGADGVEMGEFAEFGPLDVQLTDELERGKRPFSPLDEFKSMEFLREYATEFLDEFAFALSERGMSVKQALHDAIPAVTGMMTPMFSHIDPSKVGTYRRALAQGEEYASRLLKSCGNPRAATIVRRLVWDYPDHRFVINRDEAVEMGLPVKPLPQAQERILFEAIQELNEHYLAYHGFAGSGPKTTRARKPGGKQTSIHKLPPAGANGTKKAETRSAS